MKFFVSIILLCLSLTAFCQESHRYAQLINTETLHRHLSIIAGDEMEGRETGTEGQRKAADYIRSQFMAAGLSFPKQLNGYLQEYPLHKDSLVESEFKMGELKAEQGSDYIIPLNNTTDVKIKSNSVVFAGYGIEDENYSDYKGTDVKGKVVVVFMGEPKENGKYLVSGTEKSSEWTYPGISKKVSLAAGKGAAAIVFVNPMQEKIPSRMAENAKKTNLYYPRPGQEYKTTYMVISQGFFKKMLGAGAETLLSTAKKSGVFERTSQLEKNIKTKIKFKKQQKVVTASNVLGVVEGSDKKDEYIFVTAHYDHLGVHDGKIYYGADDDGSGTCAVINMAAAFAQAKADGHGPRRTMVFMTVSGEEKGLLGSEYYSENPVYPLDKTTVDLNIDMIGRIDTERMKEDTLNYIYVVGHDKISTELPLINESVNNKYTQLTLDYKFDDPNDKERIYFRSDHYNFARKGVPVLFFYDGMLKADYHKPTDTIDKINWSLFEKRARMIFYTAWEIANRDNMLTRDLPIPTMTR